MRSIIVFILSGFLVFSCNETGKAGSESSQEKDSTVNGSARVQFYETRHDFGKVAQGEKVGWYFKYKNTGDVPLIIERVTATCGCTVPEYTKEPLPPGEEGSIKVMYDSKGRSGKDFKTVTVETNAENNIVKLELTVEVLTQ